MTGTLHKDQHTYLYLAQFFFEWERFRQTLYRKPYTHLSTVTLFSKIVPIMRYFTYSMVQSPSWKANWFAASQEIPRISRNGSLLHSQASATCIYPGPAQSSPYTHIPPPWDPS